MALFLISPDSLMSQFIALETGQALSLSESRGLRIIPILLRPCDWSNLPIARFTAFPTNGRPVTSWSNQDEAFFVIAKGIEQAAESILAARREAGSHSGVQPLVLPTGIDRLHVAYLAVLENPKLFSFLEPFDETVLSSIATQLSVAPDKLLETLRQRHPNSGPPPLWLAWMQTVHPTKLGAAQK